MAETQRQPVPRVDESEIATGLALLGFARECVLKKLDGVADDDVRRPLVPSGTNLLGLVRHLAASERYWFHHHLAGEELTAPRDDRFFSMEVEPGRSTAEVVADYREAAEHSDAVVRRIGDPDAPSAVAIAVEGEERPMRLRWVLAHMTTETTRHAGHADILRELLDGTTGR